MCACLCVTTERECVLVRLSVCERVCVCDAYVFGRAFV